MTTFSFTTPLQFLELLHRTAAIPNMLLHAQPPAAPSGVLFQRWIQSAVNSTIDFSVLNELFSIFIHDFDVRVINTTTPRGFVISAS